MSDDKLDQILAKTIRIEAALWPDEGQPGVLTQHSTRMDEIDSRIDGLEGWRNKLAGAWGLALAAFGYHIKRHGG